MRRADNDKGDDEGEVVCCEDRDGGEGEITQPSQMQKKAREMPKGKASTKAKRKRRAVEESTDIDKEEEEPAPKGSSGRNRVSQDVDPTTSWK